MTAIKEMLTNKTSVDAVEKLIDKSLLETDHKGNYWLHPLVREFSYDDLEDKREAHKVAVPYYLSLSVPEERSEKANVQSLIEACYHACMAGDYDMAARIIYENELHKDIYRWGDYTTLVELYEKLLPEHFGDEPKLTSRHNHGAILGNLGNTYSALGQVERAIEYYEQALAISQEIGDRCNEGTWLGNLGNAYYVLGQVERAIKYYEQALTISQEIDDRRGEGADLGNLGNAYFALGQVERAIKYYEQALAISQEIDDRRNRGTWLGNLGNAYTDLGQVERAIEYHELALAISREIGDRRGESADLGNLGNDYYVLGQVERAIEYYEQALAIAREIGDKRGEGHWLNNLGVVFKDLENHDLALACYLLARKIRREIGGTKIETTENNIIELKNKIGKEEFQKLLDTVEPKAEEIIQGITK